MNTSIEIFLITSGLSTIAVSIWIANLMIDNSLARTISMRVATKFKLNYQELEAICVDGKNKLFINFGVMVLIFVGYFSYRDYGILFALSLPLISLLAIYFSQKLILSDTFSKDRLDELLEFLLLKEIGFKKDSSPELAQLQIVCDYIIDEYKYQENSEKEMNSNISNENLEGFDKAKHHISNIANELSSGIKLLLVILLIGMASAGLRQMLREDSKKQNVNGVKMLEEMQKLVDENNKAKQ